jgi:hypothetical protein
MDSALTVMPNPCFMRMTFQCHINAVSSFIFVVSWMYHGFGIDSNADSIIRADDVSMPY